MAITPASSIRGAVLNDTGIKQRLSDTPESRAAQSEREANRRIRSAQETAVEAERQWYRWSGPPAATRNIQQRPGKSDREIIDSFPSHIFQRL